MSSSWLLMRRPTLLEPAMPVSADSIYCLSCCKFDIVRGVSFRLLIVREVTTAIPMRLMAICLQCFFVAFAALSSCLVNVSMHMADKERLS
jgi:hypothetical protein